MGTRTHVPWALNDLGRVGLGEDEVRFLHPMKVSNPVPCLLGLKLVLWVYWLVRLLDL